MAVSGHLGLTVTVVGLCLMVCWQDVAAQPVESGPSLAPVVFLPGKAGNQLEAKLDKSFSRHPHCPKHKDWYRIWMDVWQMLPGKEYFIC